MYIKAFHDPLNAYYRSPFGAVPCGGRVLLRLETEGEPAVVTLRVWHGAETVLKPQKTEREGGRTVHCFALTAPDEPCILWYDFRVEAGGRRLYVGAANEALRCGCACGGGLPVDFRLTVYRPDFKTPEWFCGATAYQIFPDRFRRGQYAGLENAVAYHRSMGRTIVPKAWDEPVDYLPREGKRYYEPNDFYFGNFKGVIDKIPYLKSLNVSVLYLNPIFESPYNHRYSISDYLKPDPLLGSEEDFALMCRELKAAGIRVVLDGVFSHTGSDSVYFDRGGRYGGGAWGDKSSPYREWYVFSDEYKCGYRSWWGFETLPEVDELCPSYMAFVARVLEKWMRLGASGWRLDVADELPNEFIKFLRRTVKAIDPEALLIGEVWEDAALKRGDCDGRGGFGLRGYVLGDMLDGVMDYPFADAVCDFLNGKTDAYTLRDALASQLAGYPRPFMRAQLGLLGSHDAYRVLSRLSGAPEKDSIPREEQAVWRPTAEAAAKGKKRLMQAAALQFAMPFAPCVYYGDEAGLDGLTDPFCRKPYPWGREDGELLAFYREITKFRVESPALIKGDTAFAAMGKDAFAVIRADGEESSTIGIVTMLSRTTGTHLLRSSDMVGEPTPDIAKLVIKRVFDPTAPQRDAGSRCRVTAEGLEAELEADGVLIAEVETVTRQGSKNEAE